MSELPSLSAADLGHLLTGVIRIGVSEIGTPIFVLECQDEDGVVSRVELDALLAKYLGQEVRFTLVTTEAIARIAQMLAQSESGSDPSLS
jgi:hypothetical protein